MEALHQPEEIIAQKYRIIKILGEGGVGITYEVEDLDSGNKIALKSLSMRRMADWKKMELFEREARILSQLNHPNIPRYLDYFQVDTPQDRSFYIAQQLAPGQSLANLVENGWYPDKIQIRNIATQILEILIYLYQLTPPVIHRDIKPQNLILDKNEQLFLVDFGAVQDTYHHTITGGSTVVGTFGYMAPEQFRGQAVLSTDLYGLATTILFLLTHKSPSELPQRQLKLNFRPYVDIDKDFADWLEKMLEPEIEDRFSSAKEALAVLQGEQVLIKAPAKLYKPKYSNIKLTKNSQNLVLKIPPIWLRSEHGKFFALITFIWNGLLFFLIWMLVDLSLFIQPSNLILFGVFATIGLWMFSSFIYASLSSTKLEIDQQYFRLQKWLLGMSYQKNKGYTENINQLKLSRIPFFLFEIKITVFILRAKWRKISFGSFLTEREKEWLITEIRDFLKKTTTNLPENF